MGRGYDEEAAKLGLRGASRHVLSRGAWWLLFAVSLAAGIVLATIARTEEMPGIATHVTDGDTFRLCANGRCKSIRLCGVNAPESDETGFEAARDGMQRLIEGKPVVCVPVGEGTVCDGRSGAKSHNRLVAQCYTATGIDIGRELVRLGLGWECPNFSGGQYRLAACPRGTAGCGPKWK